MPRGGGGGVGADGLGGGVGADGLGGGLCHHGALFSSLQSGPSAVLANTTLLEG